LAAAKTTLSDFAARTGRFATPNARGGNEFDAAHLPEPLHYLQPFASRLSKLPRDQLSEGVDASLLGVGAS